MKNYRAKHCSVCERRYTPNGPAAIYCEDCSAVVSREKARAKSRSQRDRTPQATRAAVKRWYDKNKDGRRHIDREKMLQKKYGFGVAEYERMLAAQNGVCAICAKPYGSKNGYRLAVDHCHTTRTIRALLCNNCNNGLGRFKDDPVRLRKAAEYVERFNAGGVFS